MRQKTLGVDFPDILVFQWGGEEWRRKGPVWYHSINITASVSARKLSLKEQDATVFNTVCPHEEIMKSSDSVLTLFSWGQTQYHSGCSHTWVWRAIVILSYGTGHNYFTVLFPDIPITNTTGQPDVPSPASPPQMLSFQFSCQLHARQADSA